MWSPREFKKIANIKIPKQSIIYPNFLTKKLGYVDYQSTYRLAQFYEALSGLVICYNVYNDSYVEPDGYGQSSSPATSFSFNGGTPSISTTFKFNADDSLTEEFTDVRTGTKYTLTFKL
jgi:hypothetical protein